MLAQVLLPCSTSLDLQQAVVEDEVIAITANSQQPGAVIRTELGLPFFHDAKVTVGQVLRYNASSSPSSV